MNTYSNALQNPLGNTDPMGLSAVMNVLPFAGGAAVSDGPLPIGDAIALILLSVAAFYDITFGSDNIQFSFADADQSQGTAQDYRDERKAYSRICKQKDPSTGDACQDAKNNLTRLELCLKLREDFSAKWHNDNDPGHVLEIERTRRAVENAEETVQDLCTEEDCE